MNTEQINGIIRIAVPVVCAWLAAHWLPRLGDASVVAQITAAVIGVAAAVWSYFSHTDAAVLKQAAKIDKDIIIRVPEKVIAKDHRVASVVGDSKLPNVTRSD